MTRRATALLTAAVAVVVGAPATASAAASPAPLAREVTIDRATLVARVPAAARGPLHFSWRAGRGAWRRVAATRLAGRRVSAQLAGLRPATLHRFRLVVAGRPGREGRFVTLSPPRPPPPPPALPLPPSRTEAPPPGAAPEPPTPKPPPYVSPDGYLNPLTPFEFPDPMVLGDGEEFWAYGTSDGFQILRSDDLVRWERAGTALAQRPQWAVQDGDWHPWAPSVARTADGYVLFYVALSDEIGPTANCVGVATAATPAGPFTDTGPLRDDAGAPVGCGDARAYGNIDPAPYVDADGRAYLYVSTDWSCDDAGTCALAPELAVIPLSDDLLTATGPRTPLFRGLPDTWEQAPWAPVVENPWVVERDGTYHLLYSGGAHGGEYGMGHATAASPTGPFTRTGRVLAPAGDVHSAGGGMLVELKDRDWLVYHGRSGGLDAPRTLRIDPVAWPEGAAGPEIAGPSHDPVERGP